MCQVSVIVPVYNGVAYIADTLDALLSAACRDMEIVIVDDGSVDGSGEICKEYVQKNPGIVYEYKENGGIVSARNRGLELAAGQYVCFCDQDDLVNHAIYEKLLDAVKKNQCDMAMCGTARLIGDKVVPAEVFEDRVWCGKQIKEVLEAILFYGTDLGRPADERWVGTIWKCMVKKSLIEKYGIKFRRYVDYEDDLLFFLDILTHARSVCSLSYIGYNWRINLQSETYNWKYISEFCTKYQCMIKDITVMLRYFCLEENIIDNFEKYQLCTMFEQLVLNEGSQKNPKRLFQRIKYIRESIYRYDFKSIMDFQKHIRNTSIRKRITMMLLSHENWFFAYLWAVNYKKFRERAIKSPLWYQFEKIIKRKWRKQI